MISASYRKTLLSVLAFAALVSAETPQENSHAIINSKVREILAKDPANGLPANTDPVHGLLDSSDDCLQQNIADACFTVAKPMGKDAQAACVMYAALERNTPIPGLKSNVCANPPKNPELAKIKQHQAGQKDWNKDIETQVATAVMGLGFSADDAINLAFRTATFETDGYCDSIPSFKDFGKQAAVPDVYATSDGTKEATPVGGEVFGQTFKGGEMIDCSTLAMLTNDTKHMLVPAISKDDLMKALSASSNSTTSPGSTSSAAASASFTSSATGSASTSAATESASASAATESASTSAATEASSAAGSATTSASSAAAPTNTSVDTASAPKSTATESAASAPTSTSADIAKTSAAALAESSSTASTEPIPSVVTVSHSINVVTITVMQTITSTVTAGASASSASSSSSSASASPSAPASGSIVHLF